MLMELFITTFFCNSYDKFITATTEGLFGDKLDPETEIKRYFNL